MLIVNIHPYHIKEFGINERPYRNKGSYLHIIKPLSLCTFDKREAIYYRFIKLTDI